MREEGENINLKPKIIMTQDLTQQWLAEIQIIKQKLVELQQEKNKAQKSVEKWRDLYNKESEQRRSDDLLSQKIITSLKLQIQKMQAINEGLVNQTGNDQSIQLEIAHLNSVEELQDKLIITLQERDKLLQALNLERKKHTQTRYNLTTTLGDAIDGLIKKSMNK